MRVLLVEDEARMASALVRGLGAEGFVVDHVADGPAGLEAARFGGYDVVVLDIMLPGMSGYTVVRTLREEENWVPVLLLTAKDGEYDEADGLDYGADDYLTKPFSARELLARINAVLRRTRMLPPNLTVSESSRLIGFGQWQLDTSARHLLDDAGTVVALSGAEYRLLRVFLDHPQRVLSRDQLLNLTQGREADIFDRSIDLLVSRLRQRLGDDAREPEYIKTVRSEGYVFSLPVRLVEAHP